MVEFWKVDGVPLKKNKNKIKGSSQSQDEHHKPILWVHMSQWSPFNKQDYFTGSKSSCPPGPLSQQLLTHDCFLACLCEERLFNLNNTTIQYLGFILWFLSQSIFYIINVLSFFAINIHRYYSIYPSIFSGSF